VAAAAAADRLAGLTASLAKVRQHDASLSLQQLLQAYSDMAGSYPEEYIMYSLAAAALAQVRQETSCCALCACGFYALIASCQEHNSCVLTHCIAFVSSIQIVGIVTSGCCHR
jgi:hypothetical protein